MKHTAFTLTIIAVLFLAIGCDRGPPTLLPTITFPPTKTPIPTHTPEPTETPPTTLTLVPTETPVPIANVRRQATLRAGPGVDYAVAGTAQFGQHMVVYAHCDGWLQVNSDGNQWIIEGKVILNVDVDELPFICHVQP
jgi:hypothetical protein